MSLSVIIHEYSLIHTYMHIYIHAYIQNKMV
jgi:hypothetical protein